MSGIKQSICNRLVHRFPRNSEWLCLYLFVNFFRFSWIVAPSATDLNGTVAYNCSNRYSIDGAHSEFLLLDDSHRVGVVRFTHAIKINWSGCQARRGTSAVDDDCEAIYEVFQHPPARQNVRSSKSPFTYFAAHLRRTKISQCAPEIQPIVSGSATIEAKEKRK